MFDRGSNTTSSEGDTLSIEWGVTLDTTITSVTIEDTMYVQVYVRVPEVGFRQAPLQFDFDGAGNISNVKPATGAFSQVKYDLLAQLPSGSEDSLFAPDAVGGGERRFYMVTLASNDIHEVIVEPGSFTATARAYGAVSGSEYASGISDGWSSGTAYPVPFDSDLSAASAGTFPNADANGEVDYQESTSNLSAIENSIGEDLSLEDYEFQARKEGPFGSTDRNTDIGAPNPRPGTVKVRSAWSRDSIKIAGVITGTNYGSDRTVYTEKIPVAVRIAIVGGTLAAKMRSGKRVTYAEVLEATGN